jgi:hypothetical protein
MQTPIAPYRVMSASNPFRAASSRPGVAGTRHSSLFPDLSRRDPVPAAGAVEADEAV